MKKVINVIFNEYRRSNNCTKIYNKCKCLQQKLSSLIEDLKEKYYNELSSKLNATNIGPKAYWSKLKNFINNKKIIVSHLFHEYEFVVD